MQQPREKTITETARSSGMSLRTLRFYEQIKMLKPRRDGLVRYYSEADTTTLALIQKGKRLRFSLKEIAGLLSRSPSQASSSRTERAMMISPEVAARQLVFLKGEAVRLHEAIVELETYAPVQAEAHA